MLRNKKNWILQTLLICFFVSTLNCGHTPRTREKYALDRDLPNKPIIKILIADLKMTYEATQRALAIYLIQESRLDTKEGVAILTTQLLIGQAYNEKLYTSPEPPQFHQNIRSNLIIRMKEGKKAGRKATKVEIQKTLQIQDTYEGWVNLSSDYLEETIIIDHIHEEIFNTLALEKARKKKTLLQNKPDSTVKNVEPKKKEPLMAPPASPTSNEESEKEGAMSDPSDEDSFPSEFPTRPAD